MESWKTLARRHVVDFGKWLTVESHIVQLHDGRIIENWPWIVTPDYINVLVETEDRQFLCFRQTKYAVKGISLAPVGGYIEPSEDPLAAAKRELLEETGCAASEWINLGRYNIDGNRGVGIAHLFLARGAHRVKEAVADDLEEQQIVWLNRPEIEAALAVGEFKVLAWQAVVALGLLRLEKIKEEKMPEIKHFPKTRVAYLEIVGPYGEATARGFDELFQWLDANKVQPVGAPIGIYYDDPIKVPPEKMRADMCAPVAPDVKGTGKVKVKDIGDIEVATIMYQGEQTIQPAYSEVYDWLHSKGYYDVGAPIETYFSHPPDEMRGEVAVPIAKLPTPLPKKHVLAKPAKRAAKKPVKKVAKKSVKKATKKVAKKAKRK